MSCQKSIGHTVVKRACHEDLHTAIMSVLWNINQQDTPKWESRLQRSEPGREKQLNPQTSQTDLGDDFLRRSGLLQERERLDMFSSDRESTYPDSNRDEPVAANTAQEDLVPLRCNRLGAIGVSENQ